MKQQGLVWVPYTIVETIDGPSKEYKDFMSEYKEKHKCCPKYNKCCYQVLKVKKIKKKKMNDPVISNMLERDKDELPQYFKSFEDLGCHYDFDRMYSWYEVSWKGKQMIQIESGTTKDRFIELMVEFFTDAWDLPPIFLASTRKKKKLFEFCQLFPEFNEKIKGLEVNLIDD